MQARSASAVRFLSLTREMAGSLTREGTGPSLWRMRLLAVLLSLGLLAGCSSPHPAPSPAGSPGSSASPDEADDRALPDPLPEIVARIDGEPVYLRELVPLARTKLDKFKFNQAKEKPRIMRQSLRAYIDRELLLREALAQGTQADTKMVQQMYDAAHADYPDEEKWKANLYWRGFDPQSFKAELRVQQTIDVYLAKESGAREAVDAADAADRRNHTMRVILEKLRAKARIETYI